MELERGQCCCCNTGKILVHKNPSTCEKLFIHLFGDIKEVKDKLLLLKWCPICYYKILFVLYNLHNLEGLKSYNGDDDHCVICSKDTDLVNIRTWPLWRKILEEFGTENLDKICLSCMHFMDMRNTFKEKICSRYPQLKKNETSYRTRQLRSKKETTAEVIEISDEESLGPSKSILNKLKPLKYDELIRNIEVIHNDPKFFSQVPYTKLKLHSMPTTTGKIAKKLKHEHKKNIFFKIKFKSHNNRYSIVKTNKKSRKQKTKSVSLYSEEEELKKHNMSSSLVINITKANDLDTTQLDSEKENTDISDERVGELEGSEEPEHFSSEDQAKQTNSDETLPLSNAEDGDNKEKNQPNDKQELNISEISTSEEKREIKRRPKPLSKQKTAVEVEEIRSEKRDDDQENDDHDTSNETPSKRTRPKPLSKQKRKNKEETVEDEKSDEQENEEKLGDGQENEEKPVDKQENEDNEAPEETTRKLRKPKLKRKDNEDTVEEVKADKQETEEKPDDKQDNDTSGQTPKKRIRPKPLSKRKRNNEDTVEKSDKQDDKQENEEKNVDKEDNEATDDTTKKEISSKRKRDDNEDTVVEEGSDNENVKDNSSEKTPKKRRPKPLSKKNKDRNDDKTENTADSTSTEESEGQKITSKSTTGTIEVADDVVDKEKDSEDENNKESEEKKSETIEKENEEIINEDAAENVQEKEPTQETEANENKDKESEVENNETTEPTQEIEANENKDKESEVENKEKNETTESDKQDKDDDSGSSNKNVDKSDVISDQIQEKVEESKSVSESAAVETSADEKKNGAITEVDDNDKIDLNEFTDVTNDEGNLSTSKRKQDDENAETILSPDKKKKRVTFSDEVMESSYD